jgi:hypothetical protein
VFSCGAKKIGLPFPAQQRLLQEPPAKSEFLAVNKKMKKTAFMYYFGLLGLTCVSAVAASIDPAYSTFGTLSGATFGGNGIPNNAVAITTLTSGNYNITLGLTAHQRFSNPAPSNDGMGTFWAAAGGDVGNGQPGYGLWNIGYYVDFNPNLSSIFPSGYSVRLLFDKDPALDSDVSSSRVIEPSILNGFTFDSQNSWNLGMSSIFGSGGFDPNATGEYSFALAVLKDGVELGRSAINVNVNGTGTIPPPRPIPDGGTTLALMGVALAGLGSIARRHKLAV